MRRLGIVGKMRGKKIERKDNARNWHTKRKETTHAKQTLLGTMYKHEEAYAEIAAALNRKQ